MGFLVAEHARLVELLVENRKAREVQLEIEGEAEGRTSVIY